LTHKGVWAGRRCVTVTSTTIEQALDAAYRALVKGDPTRQLPADSIHAFISVKVTAEEPYSSTLTKSALASDLDTVVKDMLDQDGVLGNEQKCSEPEGAMELSKESDVDPWNKNLVEQNCYSSPDHSPSSFVPALDESLTDESEGDEGILSPTLTGRKRRFSSSGGAHVPMSESTTRLKKRPRHVGLLCVLHTLTIFLSNQPQPQYLLFSQWLSAIHS
jgi:alpha-D-ribose 1-methylphosphonate 5-triphosphate synthase subunit PhnI